MTQTDFAQIAVTVLGIALSFLVTISAIPIAARLSRAFGRLGVDVHKTGRPQIPELGGLATLAGLCVASVFGLLILPSDFNKLLAFLGTVLLAGFVGLLDDFHPLSPRVKPFLTLVASLPILLLGAYSPRPYVPFVARTRLTIVYPWLIPAAIAVPANAVNMLDVLNGATTTTASIVTFALLVVLFISGNAVASILAAGLFGCLLAFHIFNRYPAKIFAGDTGSLAVGAAIGALSVIGSVEVFALIAIIPQIMNAFYGLSSVGRLYERREVHERPIRLREDGLLEASESPKAPITLTRLILAKGPLHEKEVVRVMAMISATSSGLAIITFGLALAGFL